LEKGPPGVFIDILRVNENPYAQSPVGQKFSQKKPRQFAEANGGDE
jgi:hypothetical protein